MNDFSELEKDLKRCDQRSLRPCFLRRSEEAMAKIPGFLVDGRPIATGFGVSQKRLQIGIGLAAGLRASFC